MGFGLCEAQARDMNGRLGIGYNSEFGAPAASSGVPAIAMKYGLSRDIALQAVVGFFTGSASQSVFAVRGFKNLLFENNLNFYFFLGAGLVSVSPNSSFEMMSGFGAEFFIPGLESLGFSVETGVSYGGASGAMALRSLGVSFLNAGVHFYF